MTFVCSCHENLRSFQALFSQLNYGDGKAVKDPASRLEVHTTMSKVTELESVVVEESAATEQQHEESAAASLFNNNDNDNDNDNDDSDTKNNNNNRWINNGYGVQVDQQSGKFSPAETALVRKAIEEYCAVKQIDTARLCSECEHKVRIVITMTVLSSRMRVTQFTLRR